MFNPVFNKNFGSYVVRKRADLKINQQALAKSLGFSAQFLGRIEKGKARMPLHAFRRASRLLKFKDYEVRSIAVISAGKYAKKVMGA